MKKESNLILDMTVPAYPDQYTPSMVFHRHLSYFLPCARMILLICIVQYFQETPMNQDR
jgi:hypothetical protein